MAKKYIIGIDEVGRGCLAGPVTVAAVLVPSNYRIFISKFERSEKIKLKDSKKLTPLQREKWFRFVKQNPQIKFSIKSVNPQLIDKINISKAANLAATRAFQKLIKGKKFKENELRILLDGGLKLNPKSIIGSYLKKVETIIKGDEKIPAIALASIVAKVHRDRKMKNLHRNYPVYGFDGHKGYGTKKHVKAIKKYGYSDQHRLSFKIRV